MFSSGHRIVNKSWSLLRELVGTGGGVGRYQELGKHRDSLLTLGGEGRLSRRKNEGEGNGAGTGNSKLEASEVREWVTPLRNKQTNKLGMAGA